MTERLAGRPASSVGRPYPLGAALVTSLALAAFGLSFAQAPGVALAAVHVQVVPADLPGPLVAEVLFPPPPFATWDSVTATADVACLSPLGVAETTAGAAWTLELTVRGSSDGLSAGETCAGTVTLRFAADEQVHEAAVRAVFLRPAYEPYPSDDVRTGYIVDRVSLFPVGPGFGRLLELTLANDTPDPVFFTGLVGLEQLRGLSAEAYLLPGTDPVPNLEGLERLEADARLAVEPGDEIRIGIVVPLPEPDAGPWVAGLQPAVTVEVKGQSASVRFPLLVSSNGVELP